MHGWFFNCWYPTNPHVLPSTPTARYTFQLHSPLHATARCWAARSSQTQVSSCVHRCAHMWAPQRIRCGLANADAHRWGAAPPSSRAWWLTAWATSPGQLPCSGRANSSSSRCVAALPMRAVAAPRPLLLHTQAHGVAALLTDCMCARRNGTAALADGQRAVADRDAVRAHEPRLRVTCVPLRGDARPHRRGLRRPGSHGLSQQRRHRPGLPLLQHLRHQSAPSLVRLQPP